MAKFKEGDLITPSRDYLDARNEKRLTKGKPYVLKNFGPANGVYPKGSLVLEADDIGVSSCWPVSGFEHGGPMEWSLYQPAAATPFTLLDDEGRKALKAGDRVLVEVLVVSAANEDGEIPYSGTHALDTWATFAAPEDFFAILPPAEKPIAVGDLVSIATQSGTKGKVLAFTSAGVPVVEFADGNGLTARAFDASVLEVI